MNINQRVKVKETGEVGTIEAFQLYSFEWEVNALVRFEDADLVPFSISDLEVIVQPGVYVRYLGNTDALSKLTQNQIYEVYLVFPHEAGKDTAIVIHNKTRFIVPRTWDYLSKFELVPDLTPTAAAVSIDRIRQPVISNDPKRVRETIWGTSHFNRTNMIRAQRARRKAGLLKWKGNLHGESHENHSNV